MRHRDSPRWLHEYVGTRRVVSNAHALVMTQRLNAGDLRWWSTVKSFGGSSSRGGDEVTAGSDDAYVVGALESLEEWHGAEDLLPTPALRSPYSPDEVRVLVEEYGGLDEVVRWSRIRAEGRRLGLAEVHVRLLDLRDALERLTFADYEPLEWHGLKNFSLAEAAQLVGGRRSTLHDRYRRALQALVRQLNGDLTGSVMGGQVRRKLAWREWVGRDARAPIPAPVDVAINERSSRGRPIRIAPEIEDRIIDMYRAGKTLQAIADDFNEEGVPAPGGTLWRHTSVRSVLRRRRVPLRPRGRRPRPGTYSPGHVTRSDYDELLAAERRSDGIRAQSEL